MADALGSYPQFRLNFEQQGKRAKDLLKAARAGEAEALARFKSPPRLAEAQYLIARELRFDNWASMKRHISEMTLAREAMHASAPDSDLPTLHIRCGHDLQESLKEAGFGGDYYVDIYPYIIGPVREGSGYLEQRARHIVDCYGDQFDPPLEYEGQLRSLKDKERELHDSADYERVVLWFEHDVTDQLSLIHLLGHYAIHRRPSRLELVSISDFPGARRFTGLGELPPEALRLLWTTRKHVSAAQLRLGLDAWRALANPDPLPLAAIINPGYDGSSPPRRQRYAGAAVARSCPPSPFARAALQHQWPVAHRGDGANIDGAAAPALGWQRQSRKDLFGDALGHRSASRARRPSCARSRAQHGRRECSRFRAPRRRQTRR